MLVRCRNICRKRNLLRYKAMLKGWKLGFLEILVNYPAPGYLRIRIRIANTNPDPGEPKFMRIRIRNTEIKCTTYAPVARTMQWLGRLLAWPWASLSWAATHPPPLRTWSPTLRRHSTRRSSGVSLSLMFFFISVLTFGSFPKQCCGSGAFLTPGFGIRDAGWVKNQDLDPGSGSGSGMNNRIIFPRACKQFFGYKYFNSLMQIRDPG